VGIEKELLNGAFVHCLFKMSFILLRFAKTGNPLYSSRVLPDDPLRRPLHLLLPPPPTSSQPPQTLAARSSQLHQTFHIPSKPFHWNFPRWQLLRQRRHCHQQLQLQRQLQLRQQLQRHHHAVILRQHRRRRRRSASGRCLNCWSL